MKKRFLLVLSGLFAVQFLLAQNPPVEPPVEPPSSPPPAEKKPDKVEIKKAENTADKTESEAPVLPTTPVIEEQEEIFKVVEQTPEYPDGEAAMLKFFYANIRYPKFAIDQDIQGKVLVKFVVERDGTITDREIIHDIGAGCGAEALRVLYLMPRWNPGKPRGRPIRTQFILSLEFILKNGKPIRPTQIKLESEHIPAKIYDIAPGENEVFKYVEYPPMLIGCESVKGYGEREKCNEAKLLQFINDNLKYPRKARRKKVEGTVYVAFIIEKDGSISNAKLMSDIGEGCGAEALRVVSLLPNWTPGKQRGQLIRYQYELPIVFSLK
jgi:TonB family protein